jgi:hypothetical protein
MMGPARTSVAALTMHETRSQSTLLEKLLVIVGIGFLAWLFACVVADHKDAPADDAYITYVYARNVAEGHGLRFNATDAEPTSGASSLLHVFACAAAIELGIDPLAFTRALGIALLLAIGLGLGWVGASIARAPPWSGCLAGLAVMLLVGLLPETAIHLASGMESLLFLATHVGVVAWAALVVASEERRLGPGRSALGLVVLLALALTRPEGGLLGLLYLAALAFLGRENLGWSASVRRVLPVGLSLIGALSLLALWRWSYFGHVLSNSFYVKVSNGIFGSSGSPLPGAGATARFALQRLIPLGLVVLALAAAVRAPSEAVRRGFWLLLPATLVALAYARAIHEMAGGFRYEYPLLAPFFAALVVALCWLRSRSLAGFATALGCGAFALPLLASSPGAPLVRWLAHPRSIAMSWWPEHRTSNALARLGLDLGETALGQDASILLSGAGQVPWFSRLRAIDWIGLNNNRASGRDAASVAELWSYLESLQPDLAFSILPPAAPGSTSAADDPNFTCAHVRRTRGGRGSALFKHWDPARVDESFWREMVWLRDRCEFVASYRLGDAWGEPWWVLVYVRSDSPHRALLAECFARSRRADGPDEDLSGAFPLPPSRKNVPEVGR